MVTPAAATPADALQAQRVSGCSLQQLQATARALAAAAGVVPRIYRRTRTPEEAAAEDMVADWGNLRRGIRLPQHVLRSLAAGTFKPQLAIPQLLPHDPAALDALAAAAAGRAPKPGLGSGRTFTSRFRGVHQTFPTRRWEAQFRRAGRPTSLGCFDREEDAAAAYDRMMLWVELHGGGAGGAGGGGGAARTTNFDVSRYAGDLQWLAGINQDELIDALRTEGRRQASNRGRTLGTTGAAAGGGSGGGGGGGGGGGAAAPAAPAAPRGGSSTTPEPESEWEGSSEGEDAGGGAARKRRRTGRAGAAAAAAAAGAEEQALADADQQAAQLGDGGDTGGLAQVAGDTAPEVAPALGEEQAQ